MQRHIKIFLFSLLFLLVSCAKDEPAPMPEDVRLAFEGTFLMDSEFRNAEGILERITYELSITRYFQDNNQEPTRLVITNLADLRVASDAFVEAGNLLDIPLQGYLFENTDEFISVEGRGELVGGELILRYTVENGAVRTSYVSVGRLK